MQEGEIMPYKTRVDFPGFHHVIKRDGGFYVLRIRKLVPVVWITISGFIGGFHPHRLCCLFLWQHAEVTLIRSLSVQTRMLSPAVVKGEVTFQFCSDDCCRFVSSEINIFVFQWTPQSFNKNIVPPRPFVIHDDFDIVISCSTDSRQKWTSMVMETFQDNTFRVNQSTTATRQINPWAIGMCCRSGWSMLESN